MRKFIFKIGYFSIPILLLHAFTLILYSTNKGDLLRLGYIMNVFPNYRAVFKKEFERSSYFDKLSDIKINNQNKYDVLVIGDSFSEQGGFGYQSYLGEKYGINILYFDQYLHKKKSIQTLYTLLNGDFFDTIKVHYVILQSLERFFISRLEIIDTNQVITCSELNKLLTDNKGKAIKRNHIDKFLSDRVILFPCYNVLYLFKDNAYFSEVYRTKIDSTLFSVNKNELLFYQGDLKAVELNNNKENVAKLNDILNDLSVKFKRKGIKLIVLPSPDKYDIYYEYITQKTKYPKPLFFEHLDNMQKQYIYVNSKNILGDAIKKKNDIYYYDDTHWSPWASKIVADELAKVIKACR